MKILGYRSQCFVISGQCSVTLSGLYWVKILRLTTATE